MSNGWLTPAQAAERASINVITIRRAIKAGGLPAFRIAGGKLVRLRVEDVDAWLSATPVVEKVS